MGKPVVVASLEGSKYPRRHHSNKAAIRIEIGFWYRPDLIVTTNNISSKYVYNFFIRGFYSVKVFFYKFK